MTGGNEDALTIAEIREECLGLCLAEGIDFHVMGFPAPLSSEHVELDCGPDGCVVSYWDMGRRRVLGRGHRPTDVRAIFIEEVTWLAAGRGRGPYAGQERPIPDLRAGLTDEEYLDQFRRRYAVQERSDERSHDRGRDA